MYAAVHVKRVVKVSVVKVCVTAEPRGFDVRILDVQEAIHMAPPRMRDKGMTSMKEVTYLMTKI